MLREIQTNMSETTNSGLWNPGKSVAQLITKDDLAIFKVQLFQEIRSLIQRNQQKSEIKKWLKSPEVQKLLNISKGTLLSLRVSGKLPFTRVGGVIYYSEDDIKNMLESNRQCIS